ncbi:MAG: right-handed parallel beta-helix repeat-containing protein [Planctomycetes bacterium]|nr:right-handed parallel beta-helix repeat-containing protein [Planctomycetota bacterium]
MKKLMIFLSFSCLNILSLASTVWATNNIYVDVATCPNQGSGREEDPFCDIQDGIDLAVDGDQVVIAQGVYTRDRSKNLDFHGKKITVRSTDPENPQIVAKTVINCQKNGRGFYLHGSETLESVIDGLTVTNGYADLGGGMKIYNDDHSSPTSATLRNCIIKGNSTFPESSGGGLFIGRGETQIINSTITLNSAGRECGGVYITYIEPGKQMSIINSTISYNSGGDSGTDYGGGICSAGEYSSFIIRDSVIEHNSPGGMSLLYHNVHIDNCIIRDNERDAGVLVLGIEGTHTEIFNSIIEGNGSVEEFKDGGGINLTYSRAEIKNCLIRNNKGGSAGGINFSQASKGADTYVYDSIIIDNEGSDNWYGGISYGLFAPDTINELKRCVIANNKGAGIQAAVAEGVKLEISNSFIDHNESEGIVGAVDGLLDVSNSFINDNQAEGLTFTQDGLLRLRNSTIVHNKDVGVRFPKPMFGPPYSNEGLFRNNILWDNGWDSPFPWSGFEIVAEANRTEMFIEYCDIQEGMDGVYQLSPEDWGEGNLDVDPLFINPEATDYHLASSSPLINAGNPRYKPLEGQTDIDGDPRIRQRIVDMGADEALKEPVNIRKLSWPR